MTAPAVAAPAVAAPTAAAIGAAPAPEAAAPEAAPGEAAIGAAPAVAAPAVAAPTLAAMAVAAIAVVMIAAGCGSTTPDGDVVVMAASSLTDVIEIVFEDRESVTAVIAGSSTLVAQLASGAEADILITANAATMDRATADGSVQGTPVVIATNALVLATAPGNPGRITGLADLARPDLLVGLCTADVPCGALARQALDDAQVAPSADTLELNVRALATKLSLGELDAGLVYTTDAVLVDLPTVEASELEGHVNRYYIASVSAEPAPEVRAVIEDFTGIASTGAKALHAYGFGQP